MFIKYAFEKILCIVAKSDVGFGLHVKQRGLWQETSLSPKRKH